MKPLVSLIILSLVSSLTNNVSGQDKVSEKLKQLVLPKIQFTDTPLVDALAFVHKKSIELDPAKEGVNIVILEPKLRDQKVTLKLKNANLNDVIRYITMLAGAHMNTTRVAVTITSPPDVTPVNEREDTAVIEEKMRTTIVPSIEFVDTPITDALDFLAQKSEELDPTKTGGINLVYRGDKKSDAQEETITLRLTRIPLREALKYTIQTAEHHYTIEPNAIVVTR